MASRIKKILNAVNNNSSSTIENNINNTIIPSKQNHNFDRANFFNGLVYKDIMAVENKELNNVYKKSEVPVTKNYFEIAKNTLLSKKSPTLSLSECSRDTTDWLPPGMVLNKNTSFTVSDIMSDVITYQKPSCSRELFEIRSIESDKKTSSSVECNDVIVDEQTLVGKSGLKKPKTINKKIKEKRNRVYGNGKKVQNNPCANFKCLNECTNKITEEERLVIFSNFRKLGSCERQRDYLLLSTKEINIKRKRVIGTSRRNVTREYYLSCSSEPKRICQQFLLKTLDMTQKCLIYTLSKQSPSGTAKKD